MQTIELIHHHLQQLLRGRLSCVLQPLDREVYAPGMSRSLVTHGGQIVVTSWFTATGVSLVLPAVRACHWLSYADPVFFEEFQLIVAQALDLEFDLRGRL